MSLLNGEGLFFSNKSNTETIKCVLSPSLKSQPTEELSGVAQTNVIPLGSFMPIWAAVEQKSHQPLLLLMEECVAVSTPDLQAEGQVYPIITNKG